MDECAQPEWEIGVPTYRFIASLLCMLLPAVALADAPAFDRPGFAFATSTLPTGTFDWEQGLPDLQSDSRAGVHSTLYAADTTVRFGLIETLEVQFSSAAWNRLDLRSARTSTRTQGVGDSGLALKWAPELANKDVSLAVLGGVTFATGDAAFTNGRPIYSAGATIARDLGAGRAVTMYANVNRSGGTNTWTLAPSFSFALTDQIGGYVELGRTFGGGASSTMAGAGLTWLLHERVQFDIYERHGITSGSPDRQAGFGISVFWN